MAEKSTKKHSEPAIQTPLSEDVLLFTNISGTKKLSRPFKCQFELTSENLKL